uniref:Uncharacterized protein n=1 Tax=Cannabis sativa TaxID=3483 RepID=A0A803PCC8_CANSA
MSIHRIEGSRNGRAQQAAIDNNSRQAIVLIRRAYQVTCQQLVTDSTCGLNDRQSDLARLPHRRRYSAKQVYSDRGTVHDLKNDLNYKRGLDRQNIPPAIQPNNYAHDPVQRDPKVTQVGLRAGQVDPLVQP